MGSLAGFARCDPAKGIEARGNRPRKTGWHVLHDAAQKSAGKLLKDGFSDLVVADLVAAFPDGPPQFGYAFLTDLGQFRQFRFQGRQFAAIY